MSAPLTYFVCACIPAASSLSAVLAQAGGVFGEANKIKMKGETELKKRSHRQIFNFLTAGSILLLLLAVLHAEKKTPPKKQIPFVQAKNPEEAGRYLVLASGCNDCHTPGWNESRGKLPEKQWLTGSPVGYQGPWGTTYASNLRLLVQSIDEKTWNNMLKTGDGNPPMPWQNYRYLNKKDIKALYAFIKSLGPSGKATPDYVPPDKKPQTPYILMVPQQKPSK